MARPRSFDPNEVLDIARDVFWRKGFQATSLDEITAATGIAKPSLYAAFGDKNALFLNVLNRYHDGILARAEHVLAQGSSAREAIERWMIGFVPYCSGAKGSRGCMSVNTAVDGSLDQVEVRRSVARFNNRLEELLRARLCADRAQFSRDFDPDVAAHALMAIYTGLMVLAKQAPGREKVKSVIRQATKLLVPGPPGT